MEFTVAYEVAYDGKTDKDTMVVEAEDAENALVYAGHVLDEKYDNPGHDGVLLRLEVVE